MNPDEAAAAVAVICTLKDEILVLQRSRNPDDPWSGHLALPGGRREKQDQSLFHTCLRETREECCIELNENQLVSTLEPRLAGRYAGQPVLVQPFVFRIEAALPLKLEAKEIHLSLIHI